MGQFGEEAEGSHKINVKGPGEWDRARRRREITHHLRGGGDHKIGWVALSWQEMLNTDEVRFGKHPVLRSLPKKIANFLHEYHSCKLSALFCIANFLHEYQGHVNEWVGIIGLTRRNMQ